MSIKKYFATLFVVIIYLTTTFGQTFTEEMEAIADIIVDTSGAGDYKTIQEAFNAIPNESDDTTIVFVKKGTYEEKIILYHTKWNVILVGEDVDSTIITGDDYGDEMLIDDDINNGGHTFSTYTFRADPHGFQAYNITFENTTTSGQGVAYHSNGDKQILYHCRMLGYQDTYFDNLRTRRYIKDCFIEGVTDYIFGFGITLFDSCQMYTPGSGYITAASTPQYYRFGYVFKNCWLTTTPSGANSALGRPWFPYAYTMFYECWETEHINSSGWTSWYGDATTNRYWEYNCSGPGYKPESRVIGQQLPDSLADQFDIDTIFAASAFPSDMGELVDSLEIWTIRNRFEDRGYVARADTFLFAGRGEFPSYPLDDWSPVFNDDVLKIMQKYQLTFLDSAYNECSLDSVYFDGAKIESFNLDNDYFPIELGSDYEGIPELTVYNDKGVSRISYPTETPGIATLKVVSYNKTNQIEREVYFSKDSIFWNPEPIFFVFNRRDTVYCEEGVYDYTLTLTKDKTSVSNFKANKLLGQTFTTVEPESYPGDYKITMKAASEVDSIVYTVTVNTTAGIQDSEYLYGGISVTNPISDNLLIHCDETIDMQGTISIYSLDGKKLFAQSFEGLHQGVNEFSVETLGLESGLYLYRIDTETFAKGGKLIKQ